MTVACRTVMGQLGRRGTAAVEFALIAPVMIVMMFSTIELINAFRVQAKVHTMAGQLAELVASSAAVTAPGSGEQAPGGSLADACTGAALNLLPYSKGAVSVQIASVSVDHPSNRIAGSTDSKSVQAYLDWENDTACPQRASGSLGRAGAFALVDQPLSMLTKSGASANAVDNQSLTYGYSAVVVAVQYSYSNVAPYSLKDLLSFSSTAVVRPRANTTIACTNVAGTSPCPQIQ